MNVGKLWLESIYMWPWYCLLENKDMSTTIRIFLQCTFGCWSRYSSARSHDDFIKWEHFPRYWPFVRGIHRSPVNSSHKGQWHGTLMFPLMWAWINGWVNNGEAGDLRCHPAHYDVIVCWFPALVQAMAGAYRINKKNTTETLIFS